MPRYLVMFDNPIVVSSVLSFGIHDILVSPNVTTIVFKEFYFKTPFFKSFGFKIDFFL